MRSPAVCALTGITYRQLDFLTREAECGAVLRLVVPPQGSGNARRWPSHVVRRLMVAGHADRYGMGFPRGQRLNSTSQFPRLAAAILLGPEPPDTGWLILGSSDQSTVHYATTPAEAVDRVVALGHGCQIIDYDLHALAADAGVDDLHLALAGHIPAGWPNPTTRTRQLVGAA